MANEEQTIRQPINPEDIFELGYLTGQMFGKLSIAPNLSMLTTAMLGEAKKKGAALVIKSLKETLEYCTQKLAQGQIVGFSKQNPDINIKKAMQDEFTASMADIIHYGIVIREEENPASEFKKYTIMTSDGKHQIIPAISLRPVTADKIPEELLTGIFATRSFREENGNIIMEVLPEDLQARNVGPSQTENPTRK